MFKANEKKEAISFTFSSKAAFVDKALLQANLFFNKFNIKDKFALKVVFRELLINAIEHGNKEIESKKVFCGIEHIKDFRFKITVEDEGDGFERAKVNMNINYNPRQERHRGYVLINTFADQIMLENGGRKVTAFVNAPGKTPFDIQEDIDNAVIRPKSNINSSSSENLRRLLLSLLDSGKNKFCFDFSEVQDIDSVGLSVLIDFASSFRNKFPDGNKIRIINANSECLRLLKIIKLDTIFKIIEN